MKAIERNSLMDWNSWNYNFMFESEMILRRVCGQCPAWMHSCGFFVSHNCAKWLLTGQSGHPRPVWLPPQTFHFGQSRLWIWSSASHLCSGVPPSVLSTQQQLHGQIVSHCSQCRENGWPPLHPIHSWLALDASSQIHKLICQLKVFTNCNKNFLATKKVKPTNARDSLFSIHAARTENKTFISDLNILQIILNLPFLYAACE